MTYQGVGLANFLGRLLEAALGLVDLAVAAVNVVLHVAQVVKVEPPAALLVGVGVGILCLEGVVVGLWAGAELVFCVCEEVVGAVADEIGAADLGVGDGELGGAGVGSAHELLAHELLWGVLVVWYDVGMDVDGEGYHMGMDIMMR